GLRGLRDVLHGFHPDNVVVQGDATSSFVGALASFYARASISHVEAGLRSGDKEAPYPEEVNRILISHIADYHFAPTERARANLAAEGLTENVWVVGNTVIDALQIGLELIDQEREELYQSEFGFLDFSKRIILVTAHRRESFGKPVEEIGSAIRELSDRFADVQFVYPVHLNPNIKGPMNRMLGEQKNV